MRPLNRVLFFLLLSIFAFTACNIANLKPDIDKDEGFIIDCIATGGGDSFLLMQGGKTILIDTGFEKSYKEIKATLENYQIEKLDYLILTHNHKDHIGGASTLLSRYGADHVLMVKEESDTKLYFDLLFSLNKYTKKVSYPESGDTLKVADLSITFLNPQKTRLLDENNDSLVFKIKYKNQAYLFLGDLEKTGEKVLLETDVDLKSDWVKIGNHGQDDTTSSKFIKAVAPSYAVISTKSKRSSDEAQEKLAMLMIETTVVLKNTHAVFITKDDKITQQSYGRLVK
jgi:competence protein ComEC